ncbi:hypothetical protein MTO96_037424 [Rhipicephalus appendiculatus]
MTGVQCSLSTTDKSVGCSCKAKSRSAQTDPQAIDRACSTEDSRDSTVTVLPAASVIEQNSTNVVQVGPVTRNDTNLFSTLCCIGVVTTCQEASVQSTSSGTCGTESASHANQKGPSNAVTTGVQCSLYMADKSVGCSYKAESRSAQTDPHSVDRACSTEDGLPDALSQQQEPSFSSNNDEEGRHNNGKFGSTKRNVSRCLSIMSDPKYCGLSFGDDCDPTEVLKSDTLYSLEKNKEDEDHQQRDGAQEAVVSTSLPPQSFDPVMTMPPLQSRAHLQALRTEIAYQHHERPLSPQKDMSTIRHRQSPVSQVPLKDVPPLWPPPFTTRLQAQQLSQKKIQRPLDEKEFEQQPEVLWRPGGLAGESMVENITRNKLAAEQAACLIVSSDIATAAAESTSTIATAPDIEQHPANTTFGKDFEGGAKTDEICEQDETTLLAPRKKRRHQQPEKKGDDSGDREESTELVTKRRRKSSA